MTDEEAFDVGSLDALLNSVRTSPQQEGEVSDLTATDALSSLGELSRAHAQATEAHERGDMHIHHHHHHKNHTHNQGMMGQQIQPQPQQGINFGGGVDIGNNLFQPSQPVSVSTGAMFSIPPIIGMDYNNNGGGFFMGFNEGMAQKQAQAPFAMMPQQQHEQRQAMPALSNPLMSQAAQVPQSTNVTFQAQNFAQHQQPQLGALNLPSIGQLKSPNPSASATTSATVSGRPTRSNKRKKAPQSISATSSSYPPISEDESDRQKRRSQRNLREQERSHQITSRINELRDLLAQAGVHFKPDRYSTLVGVVNYIKMLQGRTKALDEEHRKLIDTISGANRLANGGGTTTIQSHNKISGENATQSSSDSNTDEEFLIFLQGIDYKFIFKSCGVALAITSVDGRFVDCNEEFLRVTDYSREELLGGDVCSDGAASGSNNSGRTGDTSPTIGGLVTVYTNTSTNTSEVSAVAAAGSAATKSPKPDPVAHFSSRPPAEVRMHKKPHLSLFNLLGRDDMENVYAAMSRMLKASNSDNYVSSSSRDASNSSSGRTDKNSSTKESSSKEYSVSSSGRGESSSMPRSSSSDSLLGSTTSSSGNDVSGDGISRYTVDHWSGKVKHTRRKEQYVSSNASIWC